MSQNKTHGKLKTNFEYKNKFKTLKTKISNNNNTKPNK